MSGGVFISITAVPAAGFTVLTTVGQHWNQAGEALLQLLINLVGVAVTATATLVIRRRQALTRAHHHRHRR